MESGFGESSISLHLEKKNLEAKHMVNSCLRRRREGLVWGQCSPPCSSSYGETGEPASLRAGREIDGEIK